MMFRQTNRTAILVALLILVLTCLAIGLAPAYAESESSATESTYELDAGGDQSSEAFTLGQAGGYLSGELASTHSVYLERRFTEPRGHGFAAEEANNFIDRLKQSSQLMKTGLADAMAPAAESVTEWLGGTTCSTFTSPS